jgi:hypothetical protein
MKRSVSLGCLNCVKHAGARILVLWLLVVMASSPAYADRVGKDAVFVRRETGFEGAVEVLEVAMRDAYITATVRLPYLDIRGRPGSVLARITARHDLVASGALLPAFCNVYYEPFIDEIPGPDHWCDRGWAVAAPHYPPDAAAPAPETLGIANGVNHTCAMIHWVRRLPFVDRKRIHLNGASQAGYMVLAAAASLFPVVSATAFYPVVNWSYNLSYFEENRPITGYPEIAPIDSPMPVMAHISSIIEMLRPLFGADFAAAPYCAVSPVAYHDRITSPTLMVCATGDMLVPVAQMHPDRDCDRDSSAYPEGYVRDFETLTRGSRANVPFEDLLGAGAFSAAWLPVPEGTAEVRLDEIVGRAPGPSKDYTDRTILPWSAQHQWSLCYLDEGPPLPHSGHTRYHWRVTFDEFIEAYRDREMPVGLLTPAKLAVLMERYAGKSSAPPVTLADGTAVNRLNYAAIERRDVLTGLLDYASASPDHADRMQALYGALPEELKAFGAAASLDVLEHALDDELAEALTR